MKYTLILAALAAAASAHVHMASPGALRSSDNPKADQANIDFSYNAPLNPDGSNFPCKGYHLDIIEGKPGSESVADYAPGSSQKVTFAAGGAGHGGGSCQVSLSVDQGKTFKVIRSFIGGCPAVADGNGGQGELISGLDFTIPKDTPSGPAVLAWTWNNRGGNREFYMNCAAVTVTAEGAGSEAVPFDQRPDIFQANLGNGCTVVEGIDVQYPAPGPDPVIAPSAKLGDPTGGPACGKAISDTAPINIQSAPDRGLEARPSGSTSTTTTSGPAAGNSGSPVTSLIPDPADLGRCGPVNGDSYTCTGGKHGASCSSFGFCGNTAEHSGPGCQPQFGDCKGTAASSGQSLAVESSASPSLSPASSFLDTQPSLLPSTPSKATADASAAAPTTVDFASTTASVLSSGTNTGSITGTNIPAFPTASGNAITPAADLQIHPEGKCGVLPDGSKFTCVGSGRGCACSGAGWCGISPAHFDQGCQSAFGICGAAAASCPVTVQSGTPGDGTSATITKSSGKVAVTSAITTTVPVMTVTVTETASSASGSMSTNAVPTTLVTQTKPGTSSEAEIDSASTTTAAATIVPRFKRPAGSFLDFLDRPKVVGKTGTKRPAEPTLGAAFHTRR